MFRYAWTLWALLIPFAAAAQERSHPVYITLPEQGEVRSLRPDRTWSTGSGTRYVAVSDDGGRLLASIPAAGRVVLLETEQDADPTVIAVGRNPQGVAIDPTGRLGAVANMEDGTLSVISIPERRVVATVEVGLRPSSVVFSHDGRTAYVSLTGDDGIAVVSLERFNRTAVLPVDEPGSLDISPRGDTLYIAGRRDRHLVVFDVAGGQAVEWVPLGAAPYSVDVTPDGRYVLVSAGGADYVDIIDRATLERRGRIPVGDGPAGVRAGAEGRMAYVAMPGSGEVVVLDTFKGEVIGREPVDGNPYWVAVPGSP